MASVALGARPRHALRDLGAKGAQPAEPQNQSWGPPPPPLEPLSCLSWQRRGPQGWPRAASPPDRHPAPGKGSGEGGGACRLRPRHLAGSGSRPPKARRRVGRGKGDGSQPRSPGASRGGSADSPAPCTRSVTSNTGGGPGGSGEHGDTRASPGLRDTTQGDK